MTSEHTSFVRDTLIRLVASAIVPLALGACQSGTVPKTARLLTSAEMHASIGPDGLTSWGNNPAGNQFVSYTAPNGTTVTKSGNFSDAGVWHIEPGGKWCVKWHKIRNGAETCLTQYVEGNNIYSVLPDGSVASTITRQAPGNPEHL